MAILLYILLFFYVCIIMHICFMFQGDKVITPKDEDYIYIRRDSKKIIRHFELKIPRHHLEHLELNVVVDKEECNLHKLFSLVEEFPHLNKLEIKVCSHSNTIIHVTFNLK